MRRLVDEFTAKPFFSGFSNEDLLLSPRTCSLCDERLFVEVLPCVLEDV